MPSKILATKENLSFLFSMKYWSQKNKLKIPKVLQKEILKHSMPLYIVPNFCISFNTEENKVVWHNDRKSQNYDEFIKEATSLKNIRSLAKSAPKPEQDSAKAFHSLKDANEFIQNQQMGMPDGVIVSSFAVEAIPRGSGLEFKKGSQISYDQIARIEEVFLPVERTENLNQNEPTKHKKCNIM